MQVRTCIESKIYGNNKYIVPNSFNSVNDNILGHIKITDNPVLQHILLYFVEYYKQEILEFSKCPDIHICTGACQYLNKWLHFMKVLYTYSGKYKKNKYL
ncbi:PIR Superfamily Protein [Plasmodium ovale wallikeri]|uniref:PIR Superfamily Protein n=1 Tax=Plasmodium ovale wallikeri TaxID=864142 RepID=A0A1A9ALV4_PLAOA|nr:PIR Superfamily Protein [Plasmodium ovale wallikeri]SBT57193.1 PIR Superfamily Protein [Plasmodium ovale wallikeri]